MSSPGLTSEDRAASLVSVASGVCLRRLSNLHSKAITGAAYSPDGRFLCLCSSDRTISVLEAVRPAATTYQDCRT